MLTVNSAQSGGGGDAGANYYWVGSDTTLGGAGTWAQTGDTAWRTTDTDGASVAWDSAKIATFGGALAGTVTVSNTVNANAGLSFATTGYSLTGGTISLGGANAAANTITTAAATATAIDSVITGTTGLTKAGVGALTLGGANTYSGGTIVSAGSLVGTTSSLQGAITNNAAVTFNQATDGTYAGIMDGSGSLTKLGAGNVTLSGANTYSGGTTITGGALAIDASSRLGTGALTLNGGRLNYTGGVGTLTEGSIGVNGGTFDIGTGGDLTVTSLTGTANTLVKEGAGTLRVPALPATIAANAGVLSTAQVGTLNVGTDLANAGTIEFTGSNTRVNLNVNQTGSGALRFGSNGQSIAVSGASGTATNPIVLAVGSGTVNVGATGGNTLVINGAMSGTGNVNFAVGSSGGAGVTVLGAASTFTGNVVVNSSASGIHRLGVNNAIPATAGLTFGSTAGSIDLNGFDQQLAYLATTGTSGGVFNSAAGISTLTIAGTASSAFSGTLGRSGSANIALVKAGSGTLTLSGSSLFTGGVRINAGTLSVAADAALGGSAGGITLGGGTLEMTSGFTLGSGRTITAAAATTSRLAVTTGTVSYGGAFTGSGDLDKIGAGRLTVSNASSDYSGTFTISAGTLEVTGANAFANATLSQTGGMLLLAPTGGGDVTIPDLDGSGGTTEVGTGVTAVVGGSGNSNSGYNGQIRGQGALRKEGGGTLTLNGNNDFAGTTRIAQGRLKLGAGGALSATPLIEIDSGAIFDLTSKSGFALGTGQRLGGLGTILGNLEFGGGSQIAFDSSGPMLVGSGTVSFAEGFGIVSIVGLGSNVAVGTYTLLNETTGGSISLTNLANVGPGSSFDLGGGKSAYFQSGSLQLVVVPEPDACLIGGLGLALAAWAARRRQRPAAA